MKTINILVVLLIAGASRLPAATSKTLNPERVADVLIRDEPYRFNGVVLNGKARGSGFCAWDKKVFFSAAHVVFGEETGEWSEPPVWNPVSHSIKLDKSRSIRSRGYYRWTSYAELVAADDGNIDDFSKDVILGFAFKDLIKDTPATLNLNGDSDLKRPITSMITGYPAKNAYTGSDLGGFFMYQTGPGVRQYETLRDKALETTLISTGPGNSGGPVWTKNSPQGWTAAGVLVGGLPSETIVYAFSNDINYLTRAASPVVKSKPAQSTIVAGVSESSRFFSDGRDRQLPDGLHQWTLFSLNVAGFDDDAVVKNVRLSLKITTTHQGDLQVMLISPEGVEEMVHNEEGADRQDLILTDKDLSEKFADVPANGRWQVRVQDRLKGDIATVRSIQLEIVATSSDAVATP